MRMHAVWGQIYSCCHSCCYSYPLFARGHEKRGNEQGGNDNYEAILDIVVKRNLTFHSPFFIPPLSILPVCPQVLSVPPDVVGYVQGQGHVRAGSGRGQISLRSLSLSLSLTLSLCHSLSLSLSLSLYIYIYTYICVHICISVYFARESKPKN